MVALACSAVGYNVHGVQVETGEGSRQPFFYDDYYYICCQQLNVRERLTFRVESGDVCTLRYLNKHRDYLILKTGGVVPEIQRNDAPLG